MRQPSGALEISFGASDEAHPPAHSCAAAGRRLAACEKRDPVADEANAIPAAPVDSDSAGTVAGGRRRRRDQRVAAGGPIPATIQGRWGLTPADCISNRGDAKGLLIIAADSLKFYELRARPGDQHRDR